MRERRSPRRDPGCQTTTRRRCAGACVAAAPARRPRRLGWREPLTLAAVASLMIAGGRGDRAAPAPRSQPARAGRAGDASRPAERAAAPVRDAGRHADHLDVRSRFNLKETDAMTDPIRRRRVALPARCSAIAASALAAGASCSRSRPGVVGQRPVAGAARRDAVAATAAPAGLQRRARGRRPAGEPAAKTTCRRRRGKALADMKDFLPYKCVQAGRRAVDALCGTRPRVSRLRGPRIATTSSSSTTTVTPIELAAARQRVRLGRVDVPIRSVDESASAARVERRSAAVDATSPDRAETRARGARDRQRARVAGRPRRRECAQQARGPRLSASATPRRSTRGSRRSRRGRSSRRARARPRGRAGHRHAASRMDVGETVVVGTSRLSGDSKALIALLTAVPPPETR